MKAMMFIKRALYTFTKFIIFFLQLLLSICAIHPFSCKVHMAQKLRLLLEDLGTTYIKLGQTLAMHMVYIPGEYVVELEKLQDKVETVEDFAQIKKTCEEELGSSFENYFIEFEQHPIASASIAQVHKATLKSGQKVCVKVQRANILEKILLDITIMKTFVYCLSWTRVFRKLIPTPMSNFINSFKFQLLQECNFIIEANNIKLLRKKCEYDEDDIFYFPELYENMITPRVMTMEFIEGVSVKNHKAIEAMGMDRDELCQKIMKGFFKQYLKYGFFHADPHPGNILIKENYKVCLLDFGIMGRIDQRDMISIMEVFKGIYEDNYDVFINFYKTFSSLHNVDTDQLKLEVEMVMKKLYASKNATMGAVLSTSLMIGRRLGYVRIPHQLMLVFKSWGFVQDVVSELAPQFDFIKLFGEVVEDFQNRFFSHKAIVTGIINMIENPGKFAFHSFPYLQFLFERFWNRAIEIGDKHWGQGHFITKMEAIEGRIARSIIWGALIMACAYISIIILILTRL
jgi:ubiquinone biosynthesis protein